MKLTPELIALLAARAEANKKASAIQNQTSVAQKRLNTQTKPKTYKAPSKFER